MTNPTPTEGTTTAIVDGKPTTVDASTNKPTAVPTSKVTFGVIGGVILVVVVAMLGAINQDLLDFAGPWSSVLFAGIGALVVALTAYIKRP